ncbi:MAG: sulfatase-like hydrolase/transferase [Caldilineaceae bacterium]
MRHRGRARHVSYAPDHAEIRQPHRRNGGESRRRYYGQVSHIDYCLGRFLGELRSRGLYDDTVVIFTSDHGEHLGDHGLWGKITYLQGSVDVPLVAVSGLGSPGAVRRRG